MEKRNETFMTKCKMNDDAFMGYTHALSAAAALMFILAFAPGFFTFILGTTQFAVITMFILVAVGASSLPDLDNTASRAKSDLGIVGEILSSFFRSSAVFIQTVIRTRRDTVTPNPHRGFWHTIPAALLVGGVIYLGTRIGGSIKLPLLEAEITFGTIFAFLTAFMLIDLTLSNVTKKFFDKIEKKSLLGDFTSFVVAAIITLFLVNAMPEGTDFWWMGVAIAGGMVVHIFGDAFTTAGVPILFPLSGFIKGKFWWNTRFLPIKAGGVVENKVFIPLFIILIVAASIKIIFDVSNDLL